MLKIFIGWDENEVAAYHVLCHSIIRHASCPVSITPIKRDQVELWRERGEYESTDFSFSRFLVPYLCNYEGKALFMDCDMMVTKDIQTLFKQADERYAVQVCKHDYVPTTERKFLDQPQTSYPRKNWSSVMLFNNQKCRVLTPDVVNNANGLYLHRFNWLHDSQIGELPLTWNWLVGEYGVVEFYKEHGNLGAVPANLHWTLGGPWFDEFKETAWADLWRKEKEMMNAGFRGIRQEPDRERPGGHGDSEVLHAGGERPGSVAG